MIFVISSKQIVEGEVQTFHHDKDRIRADSFEDAEIELFLQGKINTHKVVGVLKREEIISDKLFNSIKNGRRF